MTADTVGGVWTYALELAKALEPRGIEIALATMGAPLTPHQRREVDQSRNIELFESQYRLEWMNDPWNDVDEAGEWLLDIALRLQPDVIHLNGYSHATLPWPAPVLITAHSCVRSWWRAVKDSPAPADFGEYADRVEAGLNAAAVVVAPSAAMLASLRREYLASFIGRVVPNATDRQTFVPGRKRPIVLTSGRVWDEGKNISALDRVALRLRWPIEVAGETVHPNGGDIIPKNLVSLGRLTRREIAAKMSTAPVYALPALYEPFGLSVLEAALSGCALVLGDIPSLRELWTDAAMFVAPRDDEALTWALNSLVDNVAQRQAFAFLARAKATQFGPRRMAAGYFGAYEYCISRELAEVAA
jgi:glycogen(starch) synthase